MASLSAERVATIVVGISLDGPSAVALRRAFVLAQTFGAVVRLVHAHPWSAGPIRVREADLQNEVAAWALRETEIVVDPGAVHCGLEEPAVALANEARRHDAALVVIGASRPRLTAGVAERLRLAGGIRFLVAQAPRHRSVVVAATDLRDKNYPVAHVAAAWADACSARVTLIHNLESSPAPGESKQRHVWPALRDLFLLIRSLGSVQRAHLSRAKSTPAAISDLVRTQSADLVVVGARRTGGRIVNELLATTSSSVLVVPLGDSRR